MLSSGLMSGLISGLSSVLISCLSRRYMLSSILGSGLMSMRRSLPRMTAQARHTQGLQGPRSAAAAAHRSASTRAAPPAVAKSTLP